MSIPDSVEDIHESLSVIFSVHVSMNEQTYYLSARVIHSLYVGADGDAVDTSIVYIRL